MSKTNRKGYAIVAVLAAIAAAGILMVPLTRWFVSMSQGTEELEGKLALQTILKDYWERLNAASYDEIQAAIESKGPTWTEKTGEGNRYTITTSFGDTGKYVDATCYAGTPGTDERKCRRVSIQINDSLNGLTQAVNLTKADAAAGGSALESRLASLENNFTSFQSSMNTFKSSTNSKFGDYYKKSEVNSKLGDFTCTGPRIFNGDRCRCPGNQKYNPDRQSCDECSVNFYANNDQTECLSCGWGYYFDGSKCKEPPKASWSEIHGYFFCSRFGKEDTTDKKGGCCGARAEVYIGGQHFVYTIEGVAEDKYGAWVTADDLKCKIGGKTVDFNLNSDSTGGVILRPAPGSPSCLANSRIQVYFDSNKGWVFNHNGTSTNAYIAGLCPHLFE